MGASEEGGGAWALQPPREPVEFEVGDVLGKRPMGIEDDSMRLHGGDGEAGGALLQPMAEVNVNVDDGAPSKEGHAALPSIGGLPPKASQASDEAALSVDLVCVWRHRVCASLREAL